MKKILLLVSLLFTLILIVSCGKVDFTINFQVDNEQYYSIRTGGNEVIKMPDDPTKAGYVFDGWYWDNDVWRKEFTAKSLLETPLSSNLTVYAHFLSDTDLIGTKINVKGATKLDVPGVGEAFYLAVPNNQAMLKFNDYVESNQKTSWIISKDVTGNDTIASKTVELTVGNNPLYYIYVTDKDDKHDTYVVLVHRNYMFTVSFDSNGGTSCDSVKVEEGNYLEEIPTSKKNGYNFVGWDYDFAKKSITSNVTAKANWEAKKYKIELDPNGGDLADTSLDVYYNQRFTLPTPKLTGYTFDGWYDGTTKVNSGTYLYTDNLSLTAHWSIVNYTITYDLDGGSLKNNNPSTYTILSDDINLYNPTKTGYVFTGWNDGATTSNEYVIAKGSHKNLSLTAEWEPNEYVITFDVNGGEELDETSIDIKYGEKLELPTTKRTGYTFDGWYDGTTKIINGKYQKDGGMTLIAKWAAIEYKITYDLKGGELEEDVSNPSTYTIETRTFSINNPSKVGYSFEGWSDGESVFKEVTIEKGCTGDINLTATYKANSYTIIFDVNGGNDLDNSELTINYDDKYDLVIPTRDGYTFNGWYDDKTLYDKGIYNLLDDLSLKANWEIINYDITYTLDGGTNDTSNPKTYTYEDEDISLQEPSKTGYEFLGWTYDDVTTPTKDVTISKNSNGNKEYTANWKANQYKIIFDVNGGKPLTNTEVNICYDDEYELEDSTRDGYAFKGWYNVDTLYSKGTYKLLTDLTLVAKWEIVNYDITYNMNNGTNNGYNPKKYNYEYEDIVLKEPTKIGYEFLGWTYDDVTTPTKEVTIVHNSTGNKKFTANWKANTYKLTYDINGGNELTQNEFNIDYDSQYQVLVASRPGYTFKGWYNGFSLVESGTWKFTSDITLVAKWEIINYTISYELNGGTHNNPSYYNYDTVTFSLEEPVKTGYEFLGWTNDSIFVPKKDITINNHSEGDLSFEANWQANLNVLSITSNNDTRGMVEIVKGQGYTDEEVIIKASANNGYVFDGWYSAARISGKEVFNFIMPAEDYSIVAKFITEEEDIWNKEHGITPVFSNDKKTVTFGMYPKTKVTNASILTSLNQINVTNEKGYYELNGNQYAKYNGNYYKVELITWNVNKNEGENKYYLMSQCTLDYGAYNTTYLSSNFYENSTIRTWMNSSFFNDAFDNQEIILTTEVHTNYKRYDSSVSEITYDKVFAPTTTEIYSVNSTDYTCDKAKSNSSYNDDTKAYYYWTRMPCNTDTYSTSNGWNTIYCVRNSPKWGWLALDSDWGRNSLGLLPCLWIEWD